MIFPFTDCTIRSVGNKIDSSAENVKSTMAPKAHTVTEGGVAPEAMYTYITINNMMKICK